MYKGKFSSYNQKTPHRSPIKTGTIVFYSILLGFILIFCVGLFFAMNALNDWLVRFEASQPHTKCQAVFAELFETPDWKQICKLASGDIPPEEYADYMEQKVGGQKLTYIETSAGLSGDKKYIVRCGSEKVATFTLQNVTPNADIPDWQLGTVEIFYQAKLSVYIQVAPEHTVLVNGQVLDDSYVIRTISTKAEDYLPEGIHGYRVKELVVHNLLTEPDIQVLDPQGTPVELGYDYQTQCYTVVSDPAELTEEHRKTLVTAAQTYCKYMIGDEPRAGLRRIFHPQSNIYQTIIGNTTWMQSYAHYELGEVTISDYDRYSEEHFSARVSMTMNVTRKDGSVKAYQLDNTLFVAKEDTQWLVWDMINSNPRETVTQVLLTYMSDDQVISTEMVNAKSSKLVPPAVTPPEGKTFAGWFTQTVNEAGQTTMELAFLPGEDGSVILPAGTELGPMTLYALYQ